jgi:hypothetical protein
MDSVDSADFRCDQVEIPQAWDHCSQEEVFIRQQFDMQSKFGPSIGISRLDRYKRAQELRIPVSEQVATVLTSPKINSLSIFDQ